MHESLTLTNYVNSPRRCLWKRELMEQRNQVQVGREWSKLLWQCRRQNWNWKLIKKKEETFMPAKVSDMIQRGWWKPERVIVLPWKNLKFLLCAKGLWRWRRPRSEGRRLLIAAYPERAAVIKVTRMKANCSDSEDYVSLIDMMVTLWEADGDGVEDEMIWFFREWFYNFNTEKRKTPISFPYSSTKLA